MSNGSVRRSRFTYLTVLALATPLLAQACQGQESGLALDEPAGPASATAFSRDLSLGSVGSDVAALQDYLGRYGYFPNHALAEQHPLWRPVVKAAPRVRGVFDDTTQGAVRAFQQNAGITVTGVFDRATRETLVSPRCAVPEGVSRPDPRDKFDILGPRWTRTALTWRVTSAPSPLSVPSVTAAAERAFVVWAARTNLTFTNIPSGTPDIEIRAADLGLCRDPLGRLTGVNTAVATLPNGSNGQVTTTLNTVCSFSAGEGTPSGSFDVQSVLVHEFGHNLGLMHSSITGATMFPFLNAGVQRRSAAPDDTLGIGTLYNPWVQTSGCATDIGVGFNGTVWRLDCTRVDSTGYRIFNFNGADWTPDSAGGLAVRIAVSPTGVPWVINGAGSIYRRTSSDPLVGSWELLGGCGRDIGIGGDGSVWITAGCDGAADGSILKWNGVGWDQTDDGGLAVNIAVDSSGIPWVVNSSRTVYVRTNNQPTGGGWNPLPAVPNGGARDIAVGVANGNATYAWVASLNGIQNIYVWEQQDTINNDVNARKRSQWVFDQASFPGSQVFRVSAGRQFPWVTDASGGIFKKLR